ncbi:TPA: hypothetical protein ACN35K_003087 [Vibrio parahaemolyticus]
MKKADLIKVLSWFARGRKGLSSECMALTAAGISVNRRSHPLDPSDFNRCILLIDWVPEVKDHFKAIASLSPEWNALIERWDEINKTFIEEAGFNWSKAERAPKTYALMKEILKGAKA